MARSETEHPGYLGAQDTYVGNIKGVGRIYQQTFIDTYKGGDGQTVRSQTCDHRADMLNDRVLPFFEEHDVPLLRILTDRGEYCGNRETHEYQLYLDIEAIDHTRTKARVRRPTVFVSGSIRRSRTNSMRARSGASSITI